MGWTIVKAWFVLSLAGNVLYHVLIRYAKQRRTGLNEHSKQTFRIQKKWQQSFRRLEPSLTRYSRMRRCIGANVTQLEYSRVPSAF